jgi:hypothetical protein
VLLHPQRTQRPEQVATHGGFRTTQFFGYLGIGQIRPIAQRDSRSLPRRQSAKLLEQHGAVHHRQRMIRFDLGRRQATEQQDPPEPPPNRQEFVDHHSPHVRIRVRNVAYVLPTLPCPLQRAVHNIACHVRVAGHCSRIAEQCIARRSTKQSNSRWPDCTPLTSNERGRPPQRCRAPHEIVSYSLSDGVAAINQHWGRAEVRYVEGRATHGNHASRSMRAWRNVPPAALSDASAGGGRSGGCRPSSTRRWSR